MDFLHRVDRIAEVFEGVVRPEYADLAVAERPARVEIGGDSATTQIDRFVTGAELIPPQRSIFRRPLWSHQRSASG